VLFSSRNRREEKNIVSVGLQVFLRSEKATRNSPINSIAKYFKKLKGKPIGINEDSTGATFLANSEGIAHPSNPFACLSNQSIDQLINTPFTNNFIHVHITSSGRPH
jgi:hypothetical protein